MLKTHLFKTMTAGILAMTLALTSVAATPAHADISDEEAIAGLLALLLLGAAVAHARDDDNDRPRRNDNWREIPARCLVTVNTRGGDRVRMFGRRCLNNHYAHVHRLPNRCEISVRGQRNMRHGYVPRCLRRAGFWMEGRR